MLQNSGASYKAFPTFVICFDISDFQIREDLGHNVNTYPIIHDELDEDEVRTNTKIKV